MKQCSTPRSRPPPSSRRIAIVSSSASRVWMTTGRSSSQREPHLRAEHRVLHVARRVVVVVVEADLADRARRRRRGELLAHDGRGALRIVGELVRLVRVHADREPDAGPELLDALGLRRLLRVAGFENDQRALDARRPARGGRPPRDRPRTSRRRGGSGCRSLSTRPDRGRRRPGRSSPLRTSAMYCASGISRAPSPTPR